MSRYLVFDFRETTEYWGPNDPTFDYNSQEKVHPRQRKIKRLTPEEFWALEEPRYLRVNYSRYANFRKFKLWIRKELEKNIDFDKEFEKKYGGVETYDDYDKEYKLEREATVFKYNRSFYADKSGKVEELEFSDKLVPPKAMDDKFKLTTLMENVQQQQS